MSFNLIRGTFSRENLFPVFMKYYLFIPKNTPQTQTIFHSLVRIHSTTSFLPITDLDNASSLSLITFAIQNRIVLATFYHYLAFLPGTQLILEVFLASAQQCLLQIVRQKFLKTPKAAS